MRFSVLPKDTLPAVGIEPVVKGRPLFHWAEKWSFRFCRRSESESPQRPSPTEGYLTDPDDPMASLLPLMGGGGGRQISRTASPPPMFYHHSVAGAPSGWGRGGWNMSLPVTEAGSGLLPCFHRSRGAVMHAGKCSLPPFIFRSETIVWTSAPFQQRINTTA